MVEIIWPDGTMTRATTWTKLFRKVRLSQWSEYGPWGFRMELAKRAKIWNGNRVAALGTDAQFGRALGEAGFFMVVSDEPEPSTGVVE